MSQTVWCYAGHKYPERPTAFLWEEKKLEVARVHSTWRTPDSESFVVHTKCGKEFLLQYEAFQDLWIIELMEKQDG